MLKNEGIFRVTISKKYVKNADFILTYELLINNKDWDMHSTS